VEKCKVSETIQYFEILIPSQECKWCQFRK